MLVDKMTFVDKVLDESFGEITLERLQEAGVDLSREGVREHLRDLVSENQTAAALCIGEPWPTGRSERAKVLKTILIRLKSQYRRH